MRRPRLGPGAGNFGNVGAGDGAVEAVAAEREHVAGKDLVLTDFDVEEQVGADGAGEQVLVPRPPPGPGFPDVPAHEPV